MVISQAPRWAKRYFAEGSIARVEHSIELAEKQTLGQIIPMVVHQSSAMGHVVWLCWALLVFTALALERVVESYFWNLQFQPLGVTGLTVALLFPIALGLARRDSVKRFFTPDRDEVEQVQNRAELEFYRHHIGETQSRAGILLLVSLVEHRAVVLADQEIARHYDQATWDQLIALLTEGARKKDLGMGFERAIARCGEILSEKLPKPPGAPNELPNRLHFV